MKSIIKNNNNQIKVSVVFNFKSIKYNQMNKLFLNAAMNVFLELDNVFNYSKIILFISYLINLSTYCKL